MGLSSQFRSAAVSRGYREYCIPINLRTGNSETLIPVKQWAEKYHYSKDQIYTLLKDKKIRGLKFKKRFYLPDHPPSD